MDGLPPLPPVSRLHTSSPSQERAPKRRRISDSTSDNRSPPTIPSIFSPQYTPIRVPELSPSSRPPRNATSSQEIRHAPSRSSIFGSYTQPPPSTSTSTAPPAPTVSIPSIDLTEVDTPSELQRALSKQQSDAIASQNPPSSTDSSARSPLTSYKCPVCMDTPTNATSTSCGHIFCHQCIHDALRVGERRHVEQGHPAKSARGNCPVCRTGLSRVWPAHTRKGIVPMQMRLKVRVRKEGVGAGAGAAVAKAIEQRATANRQIVVGKNATVIELDRLDDSLQGGFAERPVDLSAGYSRQSSASLDALFNE